MGFLTLKILRKKGLEPSRPNGHKILSLARLPVPTLPRIFTTQIISYYCKQKKSIHFSKFILIYIPLHNIVMKIDL